MVLVLTLMQKASRHVVDGTLMAKTGPRIGSYSGLRVTDPSGRHVIDG